MERVSKRGSAPLLNIFPLPSLREGEKGGGLPYFRVHRLSLYLCACYNLVMKVSELGEFGLINLLAEIVSGSEGKQSVSWRNLTVGIGDDAAVWLAGADIRLATIDSLIEDVHFSLKTTPWKELGWKALAVNLSDIAAMGGMPRYTLISLALPETTEVENVTALYQGMVELAQRFDVAIIGGDTTRADAVSIAVTVLGSTGKEHILTRGAAMVGDEIAVTGYLGTAAAGMEMLTGQLKFDDEITDCLRSAFLCPLPRVIEGQGLIEQGVKAAIDISDGLVADLRHICQASRVGARVEVERVPVRPAVRGSFSDKALGLALSGGEDYELLFTAPAEVIDRVKRVLACPVTVIGEIVADNAGNVGLVDMNGKPFALQQAGWEHFRVG